MSFLDAFMPSSAQHNSSSNRAGHVCAVCGSTSFTENQAQELVCDECGAKLGSFAKEDREEPVRTIVARSSVKKRAREEIERDEPDTDTQLDDNHIRKRLQNEKPSFRVRIADYVDGIRTILMVQVKCLAQLVAVPHETLLQVVREIWLIQLRLAINRMVGQMESLLEYKDEAIFSSNYSKAVEILQKSVGLKQTVAVLYLALLWLKLPILPADLVRMTETNQVPFYFAYTHVPTSRNKIPLAYFKPKFQLSSNQLRKHSCLIAQLLSSQMRFPSINVVLTLDLLVQRLELCPEIHHYAHSLLHTLGLHVDGTEQNAAAATQRVALLHHYHPSQFAFRVAPTYTDSHGGEGSSRSGKLELCLPLAAVLLVAVKLCYPALHGSDCHSSTGVPLSESWNAWVQKRLNRSAPTVDTVPKTLSQLCSHNSNQFSAQSQHVSDLLTHIESQQTASSASSSSSSTTTTPPPPPLFRHGDISAYNYSEEAKFIAEHSSLEPSMHSWAADLYSMFKHVVQRHPAAARAHNDDDDDNNNTAASSSSSVMNDCPPAAEQQHNAHYISYGKSADGLIGLHPAYSFLIAQFAAVLEVSPIDMHKAVLQCEQHCKMITRLQTASQQQAFAEFMSRSSADNQRKQLHEFMNRRVEVEDKLVLQLWDVVNSEADNSIAAWCEDGNGFTVQNLEEFCKRMNRKKQSLFDGLKSRHFDVAELTSTGYRVTHQLGRFHRDHPDWLPQLLLHMK